MNTVQYPPKKTLGKPLNKTKSSVRQITIENKSLVWITEKPKSGIKQVVQYEPKIIVKRSPFNGAGCERFMFLLNNGTIWNFYRNKQYAMWERYLF